MSERISEGMSAQAHGVSPLCGQMVAAVRDVAQRVIVSRHLTAVRHRKADGSFLTEVDLAAQEALTTALRSIIDRPVLGEEMEEAEQRRLWAEGGAGLWCIDPIDGTTNFSNGIPFYAVSVAWMVAGRTQFGVVYNPAADEAFYAERGRGAFMNGLRLPLRELPTHLKDCVAGVDFKRIPRQLGDNLATHPPYYSQRNFGSSAIEWAYLAAGRLDVNLHGGQMLWDYAAGQLILREAGGAMCSLNNDDFDADDVWKRSVIAAASGTLLAEWKAWIRAHR